MQCVAITLITIFLLGPAGSNRLHSQGFFRPYPALKVEPAGSQPTQLIELPNGHYQLAAGALYDQNGTLHWMETSSDGTPITTTSYLTNDFWGLSLINALQNHTYWRSSRLIADLTPASDSIGFYLHDAQGAELVGDTIISLWGSDGGMEATWPNQNAAGEIFVALNDVGNTYVNRLFKYSPTGVLLWNKQLAAPAGASAWLGTPEPTPDGGVLFSRAITTTSTEFQVVKFDNAGDLAYTISWPAADGFLFSHYVPTFGENAAGETFFAVQPGAYGSASHQIVKRLPSGTLAWTVAPTDSLGLAFMPNVGVLPTADGGVVACFVPDDNITPNPSVSLTVVKLTADGTIAWHRTITNPAFSPLTTWMAHLEDNQGNILLSMIDRFDQRTWIIKLGADGEFALYTVNGTVTGDQNDNCATDTGEPGLTQVPVVVTDQDGIANYTLTNSLGQFALSHLDTGAYSIFTVPPPLWAPCVDTFYASFPPPSGDTVFTADFTYQPLALCPYMQVDVASTNLRPCLPATAAVQYCNQGTVPATDATIAVELDPLLSFTGASLPATANGNTVTIALGTVGVGQCGTVQLQLAVDCQAVPGQTLCLAAHISPDTLCLPAPLWTGAQLEVEAECLADSVRFRVINRGSAPSTPGLDYVIIDDHVITRTGTLPSLAPGGFMEITESTANGHTVRMRVDQEPYHPVGTTPSVAVERCGAGPAFQQGFVNEFANETGDPFTALYCHEVTAAFDPNDKQAVPKGFGPQHVLERGQALDYTIRFQNTGNDTAFTVVLVDTLSPFLDPATLHVGAASHPYTWELSGPGILTFRFANILLPDSNVNEPASHGFVQFAIAQRSDLPDGTLIENFADIYFDFTPPIRTNTVWHTIAPELVSTTTPPASATAALRAHPVPARTTDVAVLLPSAVQQGRYELIDGFGKTVREGTFTGNRLVLPRVNRPSGVYMCRIFEKNRAIGTTRIIWQD